MPSRNIIIAAALIATTVALTAMSPRALAQTPAAFIGVDPQTSAIPAGADTLLTGTYTLRNTGTQPIQGAQLGFNPSGASPIPDAYFFFREWIDGVEQPTPGVTTIFDVGDIAAGTSREVRFQIIVRSSHAFAADAVVLGAPNQTEFARTTIRVAADQPPPAQTASLLIVPSDIGAGDGVVQYRLLVSNDSDETLRRPAIDVTGARSSALTSVRGGFEFERSLPDTPVTTNLRDIAPHEQFETTLTFESRTACGYVYPAVLVRARLYLGTEAGVTVTLPAMADAGFSFNCADAGSGDYTLPADGMGPDAAHRGETPLTLALALPGAAMIGAGWRVRRQRARGVA